MTPKQKLGLVIANLTSAQALLSRYEDGQGQINLEDELQSTSDALNRLANVLQTLIPELAAQFAREP